MRPPLYHLTIEELQKNPAADLAAAHGCDQSTVHRQRRKLNVEFTGPCRKPTGRQAKFDWSKLDVSRSISDNMLLTGCPDREYVGLKKRQLKKSLTSI